LGINRQLFFHYFIIESSSGLSSSLAPDIALRRENDREMLLGYHLSSAGKCDD
jgi:hypothetical protein